MTACTLMVTDHGSLGTEVKMGGNTLYFIRSAATGVMGAEAGLGQDTAALFPVQPSKTKGLACILDSVTAAMGVEQVKRPLMAEES